MITALLIACLVLLIVNMGVSLYEIITRRRDEMFDAAEQAEITEANQKYDDLMLQHFSSMALNIAGIKRALDYEAQNVAELKALLKNENRPLEPEQSAMPKSDAAFAAGMQNILNYGLEQAASRQMRGDED